MDIKGETIQNGEPTPEHPVDIENKINLTGAIQILNKLKSKVTLVKVDDENNSEKEYRLPFLMNIEQQAIETVLSELEKKDKEIEKLKKDNKELLRKLRNRVKEVKKLTKYSLYKKEFSTLNKQLEKKDKIIDLIVEDFQNDGYLKGMSREEILDYYQKRLWLNKQRNPLPLKLDITG